MGAGASAVGDLASPQRAEESTQDAAAALSKLDPKTQEDAVAIIKNLVAQVGQLTTQVSRLESALSSERLGQLEKSLLGKTPASLTDIGSSPNQVRKAEATIKASEDNPSLLQRQTNAEKCKVMISLNCRTMLQNAKALEKFLEAHGISVWVCTEMTGGIEFRSAIVDAVDNCIVFLPLINTEWALSPECQSEFAYAYRKNLSSKDRLPHILPIVFPDLDWNRHKHVRLLLASTNALMWRENDQLQVFRETLHSLKGCGVEGNVLAYSSATPQASSNANEASESSKSKEVPEWNEQDVERFMQSLFVIPFRSQPISGKSLMEISDDEFMRRFGLSAFHVESLRSKIPAIAASHALSESAESMSAVFDCTATTINDYDGNVTKSNNFKVFLHHGGIASSGMVWGAGTLHNNYDNVTCVWQGRYKSDMSFSIHAKYSNETEEDYTGQIDLSSGLMTGKYTWYGYQRKRVSHGRLEATLTRTEEYTIPDLDELGISDEGLVNGS